MGKDVHKNPKDSEIIQLKEVQVGSGTRFLLEFFC